MEPPSTIVIPSIRPLNVVPEMTCTGIVILLPMYLRFSSMKNIDLLSLFTGTSGRVSVNAELENVTFLKAGTVIVYT